MSFCEQCCISVCRIDSYIASAFTFPVCVRGSNPSCPSGEADSSLSNYLIGVLVFVTQSHPSYILDMQMSVVMYFGHGSRANLDLVILVDYVLINSLYFVNISSFWSIQSLLYQQYNVIRMFKLHITTYRVL